MADGDIIGEVGVVGAVGVALDHTDLATRVAASTDGHIHLGTGTHSVLASTVEDVDLVSSEADYFIARKKQSSPVELNITPIQFGFASPFRTLSVTTHRSQITAPSPDIQYFVSQTP